MDFIEVTNRYYDKWLGAEVSLLKKKGVFFIESSEREEQQKGYQSPFKIYAYVKRDLVIISYNKKLKKEIEKLKPKVAIGLSVEELSCLIENEFNDSILREIKFYYDRVSNEVATKNVVKLSDINYESYLDFFKSQQLNASVDDWLKDYFQGLCARELAFGVFDGEKLVSVTDGPDMPYMEGQAQEIGINTLSQYRGQGFAKLVVMACIKSIIMNQKCPIWSCGFDNSASESLAYSVGFKKLADVLAISL